MTSLDYSIRVTSLDYSIRVTSLGLQYLFLCTPLTHWLSEHQGTEEGCHEGSVKGIAMHHKGCDAYPTQAREGEAKDYPDRLYLDFEFGLT